MRDAVVGEFVKNHQFAYDRKKVIDSSGVHIHPQATYTPIILMTDWFHVTSDQNSLGYIDPKVRT